MVVARPQEREGIGMAVFAGIGGYDMTCWHYRGDDPRTLGVTSGTVARRALEYASDMAGATVDRGVSSGQRKASFKMVEIVTSGLRFRGLCVGRGAYREQ